VFFESPHRFHACLDEFCELVEPEREVLVGREMTKLHEQFVLLKAGKWPEVRRAITALGEFSIAVAARPKLDERPRRAEVESALARLSEAGFSRRDSVKALAAALDVSANEIKKLGYGA
jgi:16S rRNA (cytidine1402-2'-O)-methyltransferase